MLLKQTLSPTMSSRDHRTQLYQESIAAFGPRQSPESAVSMSETDSVLRDDP
jgi:hypothetical protein